MVIETRDIFAKVFSDAPRVAAHCCVAAITFYKIFIGLPF
jgi:hypothetical protein